MSDLSVVANPSEDLWNRAVAGFERTVFTDDFSWKQVVEESYGHKPFYYVIEKDSKPAGLLAAFLIDSKWFGKYLVTAPYGNFGGCYFSPEASIKNALFDLIQNIAHENCVDYVELRNIVPLGAERLEKKQGYFNFILDLQADTQAVWLQLRRRIRRQILKAERSDFKVCVGHEYSSLFFRVMQKHMRELGSPFHNLRYIKNILRYFGEKVLIIVILHAGQPASVALSIAHKDTISCLYSATLGAYRSYALNGLLFWEIIKYGCGNGVKYFEIGRSHKGQGSYEFKRKWTEKMVPLNYEYFLCKKESIPFVNPTNPKFKLAIKLWQRTPAFVTNSLGPFIIKDIA